MVWCPHANTISRSQCSFPSLSLFSSCDSSEQPSPPVAQAPTPLELFPAPVPAYIHFPGSWLLLRACQLLSTGLTLPSPWDTSLWIQGEPGWFLQSRTGGDWWTHTSLSCPLAGFTCKSPIHQSLQPGLSLPVPALCSIQLYPTPDTLYHPHNLS